MSGNLPTVNDLKFNYLSDYVTPVSRHIELKLGHVYR